MVVRDQYSEYSFLYSLVGKDVQHKVPSGEETRESGNETDTSIELARVRNGKCLWNFMSVTMFYFIVSSVKSFIKCYSPRTRTSGT